MNVTVTAEALRELADELAESGVVELITTDGQTVTLRPPPECKQCGAPCAPNVEFCDDECWEVWHRDHR